MVRRSQNKRFPWERGRHRKRGVFIDSIFLAQKLMCNYIAWPTASTKLSHILVRTELSACNEMHIH